MYSLKCCQIILAISFLTMIFTVEGRTRIANAETQRIEDSNSRNLRPGYGDDQNNSRVLYDAQDRREPFLPLAHAETNAQTTDFPRVLSSTQEPRLKVLGIMSGRQGYHAIIQDFEGKRYFVKTGSLLPSEGFKVKVITDTQLVLEHSGGDGKQKESRFPQEMVLSFRDEP